MKLKIWMYDYILYGGWFSSRYIKRVSLGDLTEIPRTMSYEGFDPFIVEDLRAWGKSGFSFKSHSKKKKTENKTEITDWKGKAFSRPRDILEMVRADVYPIGYENKDEWKIALSLVDPSKPIPEKHRLHGEGQLAYEISRHHSEGLQIVLRVFEGHPRKVRSDKVNEAGCNKLLIDLRGHRIKFFISNKKVSSFDVSMKPEISGFKPNVIWFVSWTDDEGWVEAGFSEVITYWRKTDIALSPAVQTSSR